MSKSKKKVPYAGKEKRKPRALRALGADVTKKLPVPPPKAAKTTTDVPELSKLFPIAAGKGVDLPRTVLTGEGDKTPIAPVTAEKKAEIDAKIAEATKSTDAVAKSEQLRAMQKQTKNERAKAKRAAEKEKRAAAEAGKTTTMPAQGKDALKVINAKEPKAKTAPTKSKPAKKAAKSKTAKPAIKEEDTFSLLSDGVRNKLITNLHRAAHARHVYDWKGAREAAKNGKVPAAPDFSANTHRSYRGLLADVEKLVKARDLKGLEAYRVKGSCSSPQAVKRYREIALIALKAK